MPTNKRFDNTFLENYCNVNNIILIDIYDKIKVNRETIVKAKCLTIDCENIVEKRFRYMVEMSGCYCKVCTLINKQQKTKKINLERFGVEYVNQLTLHMLPKQIPHL